MRRTCSDTCAVWSAHFACKAADSFQQGCFKLAAGSASAHCVGNKSLAGLDLSPAWELTPVPLHAHAAWAGHRVGAQGVQQTVLPE